MRASPPVRSPLDEEVGVRLLGFRWVRWDPTLGVGAPEEEEGRFLAPPDGPLSHLQVPAGAEVPLAVDPYRYLPEFTREMEAAFAAAQAVGLFGKGRAYLLRTAEGDWSVPMEDGGLVLGAPTLPEALCRASLAYDELARTRARERTR